MSSGCRARPELAGVIGPLANLLVLRTVVPERCSFDTLLGRLSRTRSGALLHEDTPFELLTLQLNPEKDMSRTALFDVLFEYDEVGGQVLRAGSIEVRPLETNLGYGKYDLHLYLYPGDPEGSHERGFQGRLTYNADFFDSWLITQMMRHFDAAASRCRRSRGQHRRGSDARPV